jgi:predicted Zn finger-like uncharacterized protein
MIEPVSARHQTMLIQEVTRGADFFCPQCGARYVVSYTALPIADSGSVYCDVCRRRMIQWISALRPLYRLVARLRA